MCWLRPRFSRHLLPASPCQSGHRGLGSYHRIGGMCLMASIASCQPPDLHSQSAAAVPATHLCKVVRNYSLLTTIALNLRPGMQRNHKTVASVLRPQQCLVRRYAPNLHWIAHSSS